MVPASLPKREDVGNVTVVRLNTGHVHDEDAIRAVFDYIHRLLTDLGRKQIVLNFADADFLPSTGLGKLVMLNRKLQAVQGRLALCHLAPLVQESLEHTRLTPLFNIYDTEAEALQSFESGPRS
jgi:anti-sigma B factor antagonist